MAEPKVKYTWADGVRYGADPQQVGEALERIARDHRCAIDQLPVEDVVAAARSPFSPLHPLIESDPERAHLLYNAEQIRHIIRSLRRYVVEDGEPVIRRVYVSVKDQGEARVYVPIDQAVRDAGKRAQVLAAARAGLAGWLGRYGELSRAADGRIARAFGLVEEANRLLDEGEVEQANAG